MVVGLYLSNILVKPQQDGGLFETPSDYNLPYTCETFSTTDNLTLSSWLIPPATITSTTTPKGVIITTHFGVQANRNGWRRSGRGFFPMYHRDISFLPVAKHLRECGYAVLMVDMRNHGASDASVKTPWVTYGLHEARDIVSAVTFAESKFPNVSIGILGVCMGAAATTYAFGTRRRIDNGLQEEPSLKDKDSIKAFIALQPLTYCAMMNSMKLPSFIRSRVDQLNSRRVGFQINERSFMPFAKEVTVPTLVAQNRNDPMADDEELRTYYEDLQGEKELLYFETEKSRFAGYDYLSQNPEEITFWFDKYL